MAAYLSITRACKVVELPKSMFYYRSVKDDAVVIDKLNELAEKKPREVQDKYYLCICKEGLKWNYKRVRRIYLMLGLNHRRKLKKRMPSRIKQKVARPMG